MIHIPMAIFLLADDACSGAGAASWVERVTLEKASSVPSDARCGLQHGREVDEKIMFQYFCGKRRG